MFSTKLKQLRKEHALTQGELAAHFCVTQQALAKWEAGLSLPAPAMLSRIAGFFDVTSDYLLDLADRFASPGPVSQVRIVGTVKAGYDGFAVEEDLGFAPAEVRNAEDYRCLIVKGDSMAPFIREGDIALVHLQSELQNGDLGVVIYGENEATLKEYHRSNGTVTLVAFNKAYPPLLLCNQDLERLLIFGKVVKTSTNW